MEKSKITETLINVISEQLGVEKDGIVEDAKFIDDLDADSLDTVELVMAFEEEFDIEIEDEDAEKILTLGDAIDYVDKSLNKKDI